jgi:RHS repeat-associated protein
MIKRWSVAVALLLLAGPALAVWPLPPFRIYPCDPVNFPACYGCTSYTKEDAYQVKQAERSARSNTQFPVGPYGICSGFHDWCIKSPKLGALSAQVFPGSRGGRARIRFYVPYDIPNNYCLVEGDPSNPACGAAFWPIPIGGGSGHLTRLFLVEQASFINVPAIYEQGLWLPTIETSCGAEVTYSLSVTNLDGFPECASPPDDTKTLTIDLTSVAKCYPPDRRPCPGNGGASTTSGDPINIGSGDVSQALPLFTLGQSPLPLSVVLSYHSGVPLYPALVSSPIADGWTHTFAQTLRPADPFGLTLYHFTPEGFESEYEIQEDGSWAASTPGDIRGTVRRDSATNRYLLQDLDGMVTAFDASTGLWLSTTDRWGNSIIGTYAGGVLTAVTDSMGRQVDFSYSGGRLAQVTTPDGQMWRFGYSGSELGQVFDPLHSGGIPWRSFGYVPDQLGNPRLLSEVRDEAGALLEGHTYDSKDRGITSVSESGRDLVTIEYDAPGPGQTRVTHAIDSVTSQVSVFTLIYQNGRWLPSRIDGSCATCGGATSDTQKFTYDGANNVLTRTDGKGQVTAYQYDASAHVVSRTDARGTAKERTTTYRYEYAPWPNFRTEIHEPSAARPGAESVIRMAWNSTGSPETSLTVSKSGYLQASDSTPTTYTAVTTFDSRHRAVSTDGPRTDVADVTMNAYYADNDALLNRRGRLRQTTDAVGLVTTYDDYDVFGTARSVTDPNGVETTKATDDRGRVIATTVKAVADDPNEPPDYTTSYAFDRRDRLTEATLPRGNRLRYRFENGTNRQTDTIRVDFTGNEVERRHLTLNLIGDAVQEEDQLCDSPAATCASWTTKGSESLAYDAHNRLVRVDHPVPAGSRVLYAYDANGLLLTAQDENHSQPNTRYAYDALDRLVSVTQTLAGAPGGAAVTSYSYDVMDNLASVTDPNGNVTTYAHDDFKRLQKQTSPVSGVTAHSYDPAGNPILSTDPNGATTTRTFDAAGRTLSALSARAGSPTETVVWAYDDPTPGAYGKGRTASMTDPSGSTSYAYERRGLPKAENRTVLGDSYTIAYRYDANGNRAGLTYPSGRQLTYGFDFADRPQTLAGTFQSVSTTYVGQATYLPFGPELTLSYGSGAVTRSASYDSRYRLTAFDVSRGATKLADYQYGLDSAGNVTAINDTLSPQFGRAFAYDDLFRLTRADTGSGLWGPGLYTYDPAGNTLAMTLGLRSTSFSYETVAGKPTSRLLSVTENGTSRPVAMDAAGNETTVGAGSFLYSARNLLEQADGLRYVYDGSGLRVAQVGLALGPIISEQPASAPVCPGASATLSVRAPGATGYQWQSQSAGIWTDLPGMTASSLTVAPAAVTSYRCVVLNAASSTVSAAATLTPVALATEPGSGGLYGDLNRDGAVDATDVFLMKEILAGNLTFGTPPLTASQKAADLNGDGKIDSLDLSLLSKYAAGGIGCLPQIASAAASGFALAPSRAGARPQQAAANPTQYFFYSPERSLLEETELKAAGGRPAPAIDTIWFGGHPVASENIGSSLTRWTFTDHLGTPFLQTDGAGAVQWRIEAEPFGTPFLMRAGLAADQRLRFPGQEFDEQAPERAYNVFRWYRPAWGRYTQDDPVLRSVAASTFRQQNPFDSPGDPSSGIVEGYRYAGSRPTTFADPSGLCTKCDECPSGEWRYGGFGSQAALGVGVTATYGWYTCNGDPFHPGPEKTIRVRTFCFVYGFVFGATLTFSPPTPFGSACGCNSSDFLGYSENTSASWDIVGLDTRCEGLPRVTYRPPKKYRFLGLKKLLKFAPPNYGWKKCNTIPDWSGGLW